MSLCHVAADADSLQTRVVISRHRLDQSGVCLCSAVVAVPDMRMRISPDQYSSIQSRLVLRILEHKLSDVCLWGLGPDRFLIACRIVNGHLVRIYIYNTDGCLPNSGTSERNLKGPTVWFGSICVAAEPITIVPSFPNGTLRSTW